jgi:hypothetical protein
MVEEQNGTTSHPGTDHFNARREEALQIGALLDEVGHVSMSIDEKLALLGELLNQSQPPAAGKIGLRWWSRRGGRMPVMVEWKRGRNGRLWPDPIDGTKWLTRMAKSRSTFAINHAQTVELLELAVKLLKMRHSLNDGLHRIKKTLQALQREQVPVLQWQGRRLKEIQTEIHTNLVEASYYEVGNPK